MIFEESPISEKIFLYFNTRIGQIRAPIGLLKALCIYSAASAYPRLHVFDVTRSREFKSVTTDLAMRMFSKDTYIHIVGEKTIHAIRNEYGEDLNEKCVAIDDGNLLFSDLSKRIRERWLSAFSSLLTQRKYEYGDNLNPFTLKGRVSLMINMATPSWRRHKSEIYETNLGNRAIIVFPHLTESQRIAARKNYRATKNLKSHVFIKERSNRKIQNLSEYEDQLLTYAKDYAILAVRSTTEYQDIIEAIVSANARMNDRNCIGEDELKLVRMLRSYNIDPDSPDEPKVIGFLKEGRSYKDICHLLGKDLDYYSTISYYKKKGLERGTLDYKKIRV